MDVEIEKLLVNIITHELDLPENYGKTERGDVIPCVVIYSQNIKLFNTDDIQITVKTVSSKDYSNRIEFTENPDASEDDGSDAYIEVQDINQSRMMQIDIYSRNNQARQRYWEVSAALKSTYAEQMQDTYSFKIGTISSAVNLSGLDGGSDINRYTITFNVLVHYQKTRTIDYYDTFSMNGYTESGLVVELETES